MIDCFHLEIVNREFIFKSDSHKILWGNFLDRYDGKKVTVEIHEKKATRSQQQHNYYWVYLTTIARETGYDKEELHELFKGKFLSSGIKEIFGEKVRAKVSTQGLTVGRFVEYIMQIEQFSGIPAPDTTAYYGYSYHKF